MTSKNTRDITITSDEEPTKWQIQLLDMTEVRQLAMVSWFYAFIGEQDKGYTMYI